ncbi:MAG: (2Fe-2S)-binding protein [Proteobacteria bacterium]|nr:MAG: (2Fe-2S)-binding protein [Pseudomonadota bacterium]
MYICLCHGINKKVVEKLQETGHCTVRQVQKQCQAGSSCGACLPDIRKLLKETTPQDSSS